MRRIEFRPNTIYCGDCKEILSQFPENCVDLIYIDPPFFTSKNYEVVFGNGYELRGFQDAHWYDESGKRREDIFVYLDWLKEKIEACVRVLKDPGSLYLHCDWHANAYIRVYILDRISALSFQNEVIWAYTVGGRSRRRFARKHDTVLFYTKGQDYFFDPKAATAPRKTGTHSYGGKIGIDEHGRRYQDKRTKGGKYYRYFLDEGRIGESVWTDIESIQSQSKVRKGFPTQKPPALLKRIVEASSQKADLVLDPMCGCGTTIEAAQILKRQWIGIDISPTACKLMRNQMTGLTSEPPHIWNLPMTVEELRDLNWMEFQNWVCERLNTRVSEKMHKDMGIDGYTFFENAPISVKQSEHIGRPELDKFETAIRRYYAGSKREMKGIMIAFSFTSDAYNEASRTRMENGINMELKTVKELLENSST